MSTKNTFFSKYFAYYFLTVHLHQSSKIKSLREVTKQKKSRFFLLFLLDNKRIRILEVQKHTTARATQESVLGESIDARLLVENKAVCREGLFLLPYNELAVAQGPKIYQK